MQNRGLKIFDETVIMLVVMALYYTTGIQAARNEKEKVETSTKYDLFRNIIGIDFCLGNACFCVTLVRNSDVRTTIIFFFLCLLV